MKKLLIILLVAAVLVCSFAGCQKKATDSEILASLYDDLDYPISDVKELSALNGSGSVNFYENAATATRKVDGITQYVLFNTERNSIVKTSESPFLHVMSDVFSTTTADVTIFYNSDGTVLSTVNNDEYVIRNNKIYLPAGVTIVSTRSGAKVISPSLDVNYYDYENKSNMNGNVRVSYPDDNDTFFVFYPNGSFMYRNKISSLVDTQDFIRLELIDGRCVIQTYINLTELEAEGGFTFIDEDNNYILMQTYIYNYETRALTPIDFDYVILETSVLSNDSKYVALTTVGISEHKRIKSEEDYELIITDSILNIKAKLNDFVNNAKNFLPIDGEKFIISDDSVNYVFDSKGNLIDSYSNENIRLLPNGLLLHRVNGKPTAFYDLTGKLKFSVNKDMTLVDENALSNGIVYYTENDGYSVLFKSYDENTGKTTIYDGTYRNLGNTVFAVENNDGDMKVYSKYDGKLILTCKNARTTTVGDYTYITATDADGNKTYFAYSLVYKYAIE